MKFNFERTSDQVFFNKVLKLLDNIQSELSQIQLTLGIENFKYDNSEKITEIRNRLKIGEKIINCNTDTQNSTEYIYKFSRSPEVLYDTITVYKLNGRNLIECHPSPEAFGFLHKLFKFEDVAFLELNKFDSANESLQALTIQRTQNLEKAAESLIYDLTEKQKELNDYFQEKHKKLHEELEKERKKKDSEVSKLRTELEAKEEVRRESYLTKENDLSQREASILNDASRDVRRQLQATIKETIDNHSCIELSEKTEDKKNNVIKSINKLQNVFMTILCIALTLLMLHTINIPGFSESTKVNIYFYFIPISSSLIGYISTVIYRIRFESRWLNDHKLLEENNIHFEEDILRAAWLSELIFEWQKENTESSHKSPFPEKLIEVYSKNLFDRVNYAEAVKHPVEDIAELGKKFSKVKIGKTGIEVESK